MAELCCAVGLFSFWLGWAALGVWTSRRAMRAEEEDWVRMHPTDGDAETEKECRR